jgi:hypothetical protein
MLWIIPLGVIVSAILGILVRRRPRRLAVATVIDSRGMSDSDEAAFRQQPDEVPVTITLKNGLVIETTAGEVKKRLRQAAPGKVTWLYRESNNRDALIFFLLGTAISIVLYFLAESKP